jgi:hypothetical protein
MGLGEGQELQQAEQGGRAGEQLHAQKEPSQQQLEREQLQHAQRQALEEAQQQTQPQEVQEAEAHQREPSDAQQGVDEPPPPLPPAAPQPAAVLAEGDDGLAGKAGGAEPNQAAGIDDALDAVVASLEKHSSAELRQLGRHELQEQGQAQQEGGEQEEQNKGQEQQQQQQQQQQEPSSDPKVEMIHESNEAAVGPQKPATPQLRSGLSSQEEEDQKQINLALEDLVHELEAGAMC